VKPGPEQFAVNEAWIVFQLNRKPILTEQDGPHNCFAVMDAASCFILGIELIPAMNAEPSVQEARTLLNMGRKHKQDLPEILFIPQKQVANILAREATQRGIEVRRVPEKDLSVFIRDARDGFEDHLAARSDA